MSKTLMSLGVFILAFLVFGNIAHHFQPDFPFLNFLDDFQNTIYLAIAAGACFAAALLVRVLSPVRKAVSRNKCKRCGTPVPAGDLYCLSCMKQLQGRRS